MRVLKAKKRKSYSQHFKDACKKIPEVDLIKEEQQRDREWRRMGYSKYRMN